MPSFDIPIKVFRITEGQVYKHRIQKNYFLREQDIFKGGHK